MKLESLRIFNYRSFKDSGTIPIHKSTVFIGESGSGKTSVLHALRLIFTSDKPNLEDYQDKDKPIIVEVVLDADQVSGECAKLILNNRIYLKYEIKSDENIVVYSVKQNLYEDDRLNSLQSLNAGALKSMIQEFGISSGRKKDENAQLIKDFINSHKENFPMVERYNKIKYGDIKPILPTLELYSNEEYEDPKYLIKNTLQNIYKTYFYSDDGLKESFVAQKAEVSQMLDDNINNELKKHLEKYFGQDSIGGVRGEYNIDLAAGMNLSDVVISINGQDRAIGTLPQGLKNKARLAVMEWASKTDLENNFVIRCYDEPDANLDYPTQKKVFNVIKNEAQENIQTIICTHSLTLINSVPAADINKINKNENSDNDSRIEFLSGDSDEQIEAFLNLVSEVSGFTNVALFYEKLYFVFEGESEEASLCKLFHTYTGSWFADLGIVPINLGTNGQWKNALRFLSAKREANTVLLLDKDSLDLSSGCKLNEKSLKEIGFSENFLQNNTFFIGDREFEDSYTDQQLANMANTSFKKSDGSEWRECDFANLRNGDKFSQKLKDEMCHTCQNNITKPMIASAMADILTKEDIANNIVLKRCFDKINNILKG